MRGDRTCAAARSEMPPRPGPAAAAPRAATALKAWRLDESVAKVPAAALAAGAASSAVSSAASGAAAAASSAVSGAPVASSAVSGAASPFQVTLNASLEEGRFASPLRIWRTEARRATCDLRGDMREIRGGERRSHRGAARHLGFDGLVLLLGLIDSGLGLHDGDGILFGLLASGALEHLRVGAAERDQGR